MAYRVKGILTLSQRDACVAFVRNYHVALSSRDIGVGLKEAIEATMKPWAWLCLWALYIDTMQIIDKTIYKGGQNAEN